ncbi:MAG: polysaccharide biosynthesis/export family protein [Candidatus Riflebacteria bacterium]|nr:polysaccharide biosynthesis/export family protein [Candidatus Riflebacteria bacterium]
MPGKFFRRILFLFIICFPVIAFAVQLDPGNTIRIFVKGEPDLSLDCTIDQEGGIRYPLLGVVQLSGHTATEAEEILTRLLNEDYLRDPIVKVSRVGKSRKKSEIRTEASRQLHEAPLTLERSESARILATPLHAEEQKLEAGIKSASVPTLLVEILDGVTGDAIDRASMLLNGKIYQSNRDGQMVIDDAAGAVILMADGYRTLQGPLGQFLRRANMSQIIMDPVKH